MYIYTVYVCCFGVYNKFGLKVTSVGVFLNSVVVVNKDLHYIVWCRNPGERNKK